MFTIPSRPIRTLAAITPLLVAAGCILPGTPTMLTQLPAELQVILEDPAPFEADPNDPLTDVVAGAPIDDLAGLSGCWGSYERTAATLGGGSVTRFYEVYEFDSVAGTANRWGFTTGFLGIPPVVAIDEGSFTRLDDGRIEIRLDRFTIVDMRTGLGREFTDLPAQVAVIDELVTLDDDRLLIAAPADVDQDGEPIGRIFTRFDCPE